MGKGTIMSEIGSGKYNVQINYNKDLYNARIAVLDAKISDLTTKLASLAPGTSEYSVMNLQKIAIEKAKSELVNNFPSDETIAAWCADLTTELTGVIGTIEVPGEVGSIQIRPGYDDGAAYSQARDGQLSPIIAQTPEQAFYNLAMLPGWQKWKPTFRYGTIIEVDGDLCDVTLDTAESSQQELDINQATTLTNVEIDYMSCNGAAFSGGDEVLIMFTGQDWSSPKVIGFKEEPKPCAEGIIMIRVAGMTYDREGLTSSANSSDWVIFWDFGTNSYVSDVIDNYDNLVTSWPVLYDNVTNYIGTMTATTTRAISKATAWTFLPDEATFSTSYGDDGYSTAGACTEPYGRPLYWYDPDGTMSLSSTSVAAGYNLDSVDYYNMTLVLCQVGEEPEDGDPYYHEVTYAATTSLDKQLSSITNVSASETVTLTEEVNRSNKENAFDGTLGCLPISQYTYNGNQDYTYTLSFMGQIVSDSIEDDSITFIPNWDMQTYEVVDIETLGLLDLFTAGSICGTERSPFISFGLINHPIYRKVTKPYYVADFCEYNNAGYWQLEDGSWDPYYDDPGIAGPPTGGITEDVVTYESVAGPEVFMFSTSVTGAPIDSNPFAATYNAALSTATNELFTATYTELGIDLADAWELTKFAITLLEPST